MNFSVRPLFVSQAGWMRVAFPVYETEKIAAPFVPR